MTRLDTPLDPATIARVEQMLDEAKAAVGDYVASTDWHHRHREAMDQLAVRLRTDLHVRAERHWDGASFKLAGIRSTSTSGLHGAINNWLKAAKNKVAAI